MKMYRHPAQTMNFDTLWDGLQKAKEKGFVGEKVSGDGLHIFCYTRDCSYKYAWDKFTILARGLILDSENKKVIATPFPKFFNVGEVSGLDNDYDAIPHEPFDIWEKMDGSLIIIFWYKDSWRTATKFSFMSAQSLWAKDFLQEKCRREYLIKTHTYMCEAVYPQNRIVINYPKSDLYMLGAYRSDGTEYHNLELMRVSSNVGMPMPKRYPSQNVKALQELAKSLPADHEGFVLRYISGKRFKIKGDEYKRLHALISKITPLAVWNAMKDDEDMVELKKQLPEEFWGDFDSITRILTAQLLVKIQQIDKFHRVTDEMTDKGLGLWLSKGYSQFNQLIVMPVMQKLIWQYRKNKKELLKGKTRETLFKFIRPTSNRLEGYTPSYFMRRFVEEAA